MKIRDGFVSNSSSSSFVIPLDSPYNEKTIDVAKAMLLKIQESNKNNDNFFVFDLKRNNVPPEEIKKREFIARKSEEVQDEAAILFTELNPMFDGSILIPWTVNNETWIYKNKKGQICVETCNNISWDNIILVEFKYVGQDGYDAYEGFGVSFVPKDRLFLDFGDWQYKRRSQWETKHYAKYSMGATSIGSGWKEQEELEEKI